MRFQEVEDERNLSFRLDNVLIMGKKIHANLSRYQRGASKGRVSSRGNSYFMAGNVTNLYSGVRRENMGNFVLRSDNMSCTEVVNNVRVKVDCKQEEEPHLRVSSKEESILRFKKSFVVRFTLSGSVYNIQTHLEMEGLFVIKVTPMGRNICLLEEFEEGLIEDLICEGETW